jgi:hypothetical protein
MLLAMLTWHLIKYPTAQDLLVGRDPKFMDIVERPRVYCSGFIHVQLPLGLLG